MRPPRSLAIALALLAGPASSPAPGQADPPAPTSPTPQPGPVRVAGDDAVAVAPPPAAEFLVIPLRVHILSAPDLAAVDCHLADDDVRRVVGKVNAIYRPAGIHWALDPIVREPAARLGRYVAAREARPADGLGPLRLLAPDGSRSDRGVDVYYIHRFSANGVFLGDRTAFVQETAQLRPVPGGIDEPLPRVTAHELGHALGLPHRQDRTNLLASGTTGTTLNKAEVDRVRSHAPGIPGTRTVLELRRARDEAKAKKDDAEVARLDALLGGIEGSGSTPGDPQAPPQAPPPTS